MRGASLSSLVAAAALAAACANVRLPGTQPDRPRPEGPAAVGEVVARVHPALARFGVVEVAVQRPGGSVAAPALQALRDGLYRGLLARGYSPLDPAYVDAAGGAVAQPGLTFPMRSMVTSVRRAADGGVLVSGWAGLVAPAESGGEEVTLYLAEVTDLAVPPQSGPAQPDGGAETGRRLAEALLVRLPARAE